METSSSSASVTAAFSPVAVHRGTDDRPAVYEPRQSCPWEGRPLDAAVEEARLVERARAGDVDAYEVLVDRYRAVACRVAYAIAGDDGEDAAQEAFVKAFAALPRFRPGSRFRPWLLRIVANEARNRRRSATRHAQLALRLMGPAPGRAATVPSPEEDVLAAERRRSLAAALATLAPRDRAVIALRFAAELSEAEMAEALGCAPGTVKSRLSRALAKLRAALPEATVKAGGGVA